jgi:hypothetical protein
MDDREVPARTVPSRLLAWRNAEVSALMRVSARPRPEQASAVTVGGRSRSAANAQQTQLSPVDA